MLVLTDINVLLLEVSPRQGKHSGKLNSVEIKIKQLTIDVISLLRCFFSAFMRKPLHSFSSRLQTPSA